MSTIWGGLTMCQCKAATMKVALGYADADRAGKTGIVDELVGLTGWHRDQAGPFPRQDHC